MDSKIVISQVQERKVILHEIYAEGMNLSVSFQVEAVVEMVLLNVVEHAKKPDCKGKKHVGSSSKLGANGVATKKYKFPSNCYNYNKPEHRSFECRSKHAKANRKKPAQVHMVEVDDMDLCAVVSKVNLVGSNPHPNTLFYD